MSISFFPSFLFFFLMLTLALGGQSMQQDNPDTDLYNVSNSVTNQMNFSFTDKINSTIGLDEGLNTAEIGVKRLMNVVWIGIQASLDIMLQTALFAFELGFNNPDLDLEGLKDIILVILWVMVIIFLIPPLFYLIGFVWVVVLWFKDRKKKKVLL